MKSIKNLTLILFFVVFSTSLNAQTNTGKQQQQQQQQKHAKYVFLFIGDGMGLAHVSLTEAYLAAINNQIGFQPLTFAQFPIVGLVTTYAKTRLTTCSAAAGTAFSTGTKTSIGTIAMSYDHKDTLYSIAYYIKKQGYKIGIISSAFINDATPCVFYAHAGERSSYYDIAEQMPNSGIDVSGAGTFADPDNGGKNVSIFELLKNAGYKIINTYQDFSKLKPSNQKIFMQSPDCLPDGSLPFAIDQKQGSLTLADFTRKEIELLDNPKGFFTMIEGGKIDWAAHANDPTTLIYEVIDFDKAVAVALEFYKLHPNETLIIVTADHETGGLALGYDKMGYNTDLKSLFGQKGSSSKFDDTLLNFISTKGIQNLTFSTSLAIGSYFFNVDTTTLSKKEHDDLEKSYNKFIENQNDQKNKSSKYSNNPLGGQWLEIKAHHAGIAFSTHAHTASPVPIYAIGVGAEKFTGFFDNTDIPKKIAELMGIKDFAPIQ